MPSVEHHLHFEKVASTDDPLPHLRKPASENRGQHLVVRLANRRSGIEKCPNPRCRISNAQKVERNTRRTTQQGKGGE